MALGGGGPIRRVSTNLAPDLPAPSPTRTRSGRKRPPSVLTDTDETDLKAGDGEEFVEKLRSEEDQLPRIRFTIDPEGELTHDETSVDVVTVPCPGGHPLRSWNRDGLMGRYYGAPSMRDAEVREVERQGPSWVRQGIRREANRARILLYEHPEIVEGTTLNKLAIALLDELRALRTRERQQERPLVFIGHSIGGLVVKMALVRASRDARYEGILRECYGVAFFGTPHQGSSYFAMPSLASSIQHLLQLSVPLPASLTEDLRMGNHLLLHVDEDFKIVSDDLRVWTFYETIDSRLSANSGDIYFTAPLTSIKSAILGMRQERIFPLQSDHANIASFGRHNVHTLRLFLRQLAEHIEKADSNAREDARGGKWMLNLEQKVTVEVHGFFDEAGMEDGTVRAWSTRLPLREFLNKGPEACLSERLNEVEIPPEEGRFLAMRGRTGLVDMDGPPVIVSFPPDPMTVKNALGINQDEQGQQLAPSLQQTSSSPVPPSPIILPVDSPQARPRMSTESAPTTVLPQPGIGPLTPPSRPISLPPRQSTPFRKPSPLMRASLEQELAIDRLSPPLRGRVGRSFSRSMSLDSEFGGASPPRNRDFPPFSQRSRSTFDRALLGDENDSDEDGLDASPKLPESVLAVRKMANEGGHRPSETVIVDEAAHSAFMKPEVKARKFVWIHLPFNNPTWVTSVLQALQVSYQRDFSALSNHDFWVRRHTRGRHSQHYAHYAKPGCYFTAPRTLSPRAHSVTSRSLSPPGDDDQMYVCLFLPYLHFDSYKRLIRRRELIARRLAHGRARPIPESVAKSDSLELQVVWEFLGHDPPINCRRTLDQYGYPSLRDTRSRDDDQMLYKLTKERYYDVAEYRGLYSQTSSGLASGESSSKSGNGSGSGSGSGSGTGSWREKLNKQNGDGEEEAEKDVLNGNVLMVDQLWLWTISTHTLLSFFPKRESDPIEGPLFQQADLRDSIFNDVNVDLTRLCDNSLDLAALAALHAVSVLLDKSSHPDLEVFRIFEEAISVLTEKLTTSLKEFRSEGFRDKAFDYEPVENKARSIRQRHKEEGRRAEQENRDNTSALLELRDIEDELATLLGLFERQSKVISSMHTIYNRPEMRAHTVHGRGFLAEALKRLGEYIHTTEEMIRRVKNTRDEYDKLLQMVQRQAQVDEVRLSRLHADLASAQSRSVLIFTTFTVIFLPLQFFTGIFGMNTREWGGGDNLPLGTIGVIGIPASVALIIVTLIIAWSTSARRFFKWIGRQYGYLMRWLYETLGRPMAKRAMKCVARRAKRRQGQGRGEDRDRNGGLSTETSDFWERHRLERERGYQIPEMNKAPVSKPRVAAKLRKSQGR
ncbi:ankyrin repeat [Trichoderma arundinaceum]|uniref:Ankyrin repeat n=1 Tax=Trichoderma arundinaceum TaxID=490622 RepID=A0A395NQ72_TRIAR|nr:ankyrin repeat [Trichoderma arundinaceum]